MARNYPTLANYADHGYPQTGFYWGDAEVPETAAESHHPNRSKQITKIEWVNLINGRGIKFLAGDETVAIIFEGQSFWWSDEAPDIRFWADRKRSGKAVNENMVEVTLKVMMTREAARVYEDDEVESVRLNGKQTELVDVEVHYPPKPRLTKGQIKGQLLGRDDTGVNDKPALIFIPDSSDDTERGSYYYVARVNGCIQGDAQTGHYRAMLIEAGDLQGKS